MIIQTYTPTEVLAFFNKMNLSWRYSKPFITWCTGPKGYQTLATHATIQTDGLHVYESCSMCHQHTGIGNTDWWSALGLIITGSTKGGNTTVMKGLMPFYTDLFYMLY